MTLSAKSATVMKQQTPEADWRQDKECSATKHNGTIYCYISRCVPRVVALHGKKKKRRAEGRSKCYETQGDPSHQERLCVPDPLDDKVRLS